MNVKVILTKAVEKLGKPGELVEVSDGYARNFLLPRKLAIFATDGNLKRLEEIRKHQEHRVEKNREENKVLAERIGKIAVKLSVKTGEQGRLFGAITAADIAEALKEQIGKKLDKRKIKLESHIKQTGQYTVPIELDHEISATVNIEVVSA